MDKALAVRLAQLPMACIGQEFPNKTSHSAESAQDARLLPSELHPVFYGCFDWHSSVHGHWMLVRLLKDMPGIDKEAEIIALLDRSFDETKMIDEAAYFSKYELGKNYERTYGWAWLLKLDQELLSWDHPLGRKWHKAMRPLSQKILALWKDYLPKQTYPNRTGVHPNTAFAMAFALDWARASGDRDFEQALLEKAHYFYGDQKNVPTYLEPDGSDFFSPGLEMADLMRRVLPASDFVKWFDGAFEKRSLERVCAPIVVSDRRDYQIVHLDGLYLSRAWCLAGIARSLPQGHAWKKRFEGTAKSFLKEALPHVSEENYGGGHWLASFAIYALSEQR